MSLAQSNIRDVTIKQIDLLINKNKYTLRPKIFAHIDFYRARLTIRLIQKICANVKTIMI
jgi:hypothetical protein